ncbi:unnamed protein product [Echinostoma caproni]|uniref:Cadherin domain-containing protein n=1 Tax=Echinostoma caproni TaxID=27848 RepID=A0A183A5A1_9TREM|nr:unnamed protein product [Echinostoma caproni]
MAAIILDQYAVYQLAFSTAGVDYFGPIIVAQGRARKHDDPNQVDCVIDLELAIIPASTGRHEQPTFVQLPVRIRDVNDHAPKFDQHTSGLWLEADEDNQNPGAGDNLDQRSGVDSEGPVGLGNIETGRHRRRELAVLPLAKDSDYGLNGTVAYSLGGPDADAFELDAEMVGASGSDHISSPNLSLTPLNRPRRVTRLRLFARHPLDYETKSQHRLTLIARDQCPIKEMQRFTELPITLNVREVNEYSPVFQILPGSSSSSATRLHPAVHLDYPPSGQTSSLRPAEQITIGNTQTVILEVPEDIPVGSRLYQVLATDADTVPGASDGIRPGTGTGRSPTSSASSSMGIQYTFANSADLKARRFIRINAADGWLMLLHPLDYELGPRSLELPILATDSGRPSRTGTLTVHIRVLDVNDEAPNIEVRGLGSNPGEHYHSGLVNDPMLTGPILHRVQILTVRENAPPGTFVAKISTSDPDRGAAGEISCFLGDPLVELPHQQRLGSTSISSESLAKSRTDFVLQSGPTSSLGIHMIGPHTDYHPDPDRTNGRRDADYVLLTRTSLDREVKGWYILSLVCHDHGDQTSGSMYPTETNPSLIRHSQTARRLTSTRLIKVIVLDENDNGPKFARGHWNAQVPEHSKPETNIVQLKATDEDAPGIASRPLYRLAKPSEWNVDNRTDSDLNMIYEYFNVDNTTGWLRTGAKQLDREVRDKYSVPVVAYDSEFPNRTALAWVHVQVTDINDNTPQLVGNTTFSIEEDESSVIPHIPHTTSIVDHMDGKLGRPSGRPVFVGHLQAQDLDSGENGQTSFALAPTDSDTHASSSNLLNWFLRPDGTLFVHSSTSAPLDREQQAVHHIPVIVRDHGSPKPLSSTATVTVFVLDRNDNAPQFERPSSDRERPSSGTTSAGDGQPHLPRLPIDHVELTESISPGTLIYTAVAHDPDQSENGLVVYSLEPYQGFWQLVHTRPLPTNQSTDKNKNQTSDLTKQPEKHQSASETHPYFIIDQTTGEIRVNQRLSAQDTSVPRKLVIFAQDQGVPIRRSYAFLYIDIVPITGIKPPKNVSSSGTLNVPGAAAATGSAFPNAPSDSSSADLVDSSQRSNHLSPQENSFDTESKNKKLVMSNAHEASNLQPIERGRQFGRAGGIRQILSWNSELITGLGIGLVVLILICLLLLVTYAVHGTKLLQRQHSRGRRSRRQSPIDKPDRVSHNNGIWLACATDPSVMPTATNEDVFKGKVTHFRQAVRNVWNQRSRKADLNELKTASRQESPLTPTESELIGDESRTARIYLSRTSPSAGAPYFPDTCSNSPRDDTDSSSIPRTVPHYDPLPALVGFINPPADRWYLHSKLGNRSPSAQAYMLGSSLSPSGPAGPLVLDHSIDTGRRSATDANYPNLRMDDNGPRDTYYTIRPDLMCRNLNGPVNPSLTVLPHTSTTTTTNSGSAVGGKLPRVTFTHDADLVGLSSPSTGRFPHHLGQETDHRTDTGVGQSTFLSSNLSHRSPTGQQSHQTQQQSPPMSSASVTGTQQSQPCTKEDTFPCSCATSRTKSGSLNSCPATPKPMSDSSFV